MTSTTVRAKVPDLTRRISYLMLYRVVLITLVLGVTVALSVASPSLGPPTYPLFIVIVGTYALSLAYAWALPRVDPLRFADAQIAGDLVITTLLVYITGGPHSGFTFFYPLSIIGAATVRLRQGAIRVAVASVTILVALSLLGWLQVFPNAGWDVTPAQLMRQLVLNLGACVGVGLLAANLGDEIARSGERLEKQRATTLDLAALKEDVIRCLSSGLVTVDRAGVVLTLNEAAAEILEIRAHQALGRPLADVIPELSPILGEMAETDTRRRGEVRTRRRESGEEATLGLSISPLVNHKNEAIGRILNFQDLTELRELEQKMKRAERLAVVGRIAAGIAHEIRNPLAGISGSIELLRHAIPDGSENLALMDIVMREVDRLNGLITELLDYARPREPVKTRVELAPLVAETIRVFGQDKTFPAAVAYAARAAPSVDADAGQIRQVMFNLLRNAAEAMSGGGEIAVELRQEGSQAVIAVRDRGEGIPAEHQERVFEPFFTTKAGGTGLGLPTVHRIVTEHGGSVTIASPPGQGTTLTVRLPMAG